MDEYQIAFAMESGEWDIAETFEAESYQDAEDHTIRFVSENYPELIDDWYILMNGENCNA